MNKTKANKMVKEISSILTKNYDIHIEKIRNYDNSPDVHYVIYVNRHNYTRVSPSIEQKIKRVVYKTKMMSVRNYRNNSIMIKEVYT